MSKPTLKKLLFLIIKIMLIAFIFHGCYSNQTVIKKVNDYEIGKRYYHNSDYNKAIDSYSKDIDHYPVHSNAYNNRGCRFLD